MDLSLLHFTAFFAYLYLSFTVITGVLGNHENRYVSVRRKGLPWVALTNPCGVQRDHATQSKSF